VTRSGGEERNREGKSLEVAAVSPRGIAGGRHGLWGGWAARPEASSALASAGSQARTGSWGGGAHAIVRPDVRRPFGIAGCRQRAASAPQQHWRRGAYGRATMRLGWRLAAMCVQAEAEARRQSPAASERQCSVTERGTGIRHEARACDCGRRGQRIRQGWAYRQGRYVSMSVSNNCENRKKSDTARIRIGGVSDAYPYRIRIRYAILGLSNVSM
jgi:hypothetical protein